jgi:hypothetical protein
MIRLDRRWMAMSRPRPRTSTRSSLDEDTLIASLCNIWSSTISQFNICSGANTSNPVRTFNVLFCIQQLHQEDARYAPRAVGPTNFCARENGSPRENDSPRENGFPGNAYDNTYDEACASVVPTARAFHDAQGRRRFLAVAVRRHGENDSCRDG